MDVTVGNSGSRGGRIALLCLHFYPEMISTGIHMTELAVALAARGWRIEAICAQPSLASRSNAGAPDRLDYRRVRITRVRTLGSQNASMARRALFATTFVIATAVRVFRRRRQLDGLLITTNPPFLALVGWFFRHLFRLPYVLIVYDVYPDVALRLGVIRSGSVIARVWNHATRIMASSAERTVVIGRDMWELVSQKMRPEARDRLRLIPNWSDEARVVPVVSNENSFIREHDLEGRFVVQYSGRMGRTHNLEPLLEAAARLHDAPVVFQLIGDGAKRDSLMRKAHERRLDNVQFLPYQPMDRLGEALSAASLAVVCLAPEFTAVSVPSKAYGIMAAGRPILALCEARSEIGRTILEADCGVVLEDATGQAVADAIERLRSDPARLEQLGVAARATFLARFTLTAAAARYDRCLAEAFGTERGRVDAATAVLDVGIPS